MKQKFLLALFFSCASIGSILAQVPNLMNYQAVLRDDKGAVVSNQDITVKVSVLEKTANGTAVFSESHSVKSNGNGVINFSIGSGGAQTGNLNRIDWLANDHFVKLEADVTGGNNLVAFGTQKLLTVPYAFQAQKANKLNGIGTIDTSHQNEIQTLNYQNDSLRLSQGNSVYIPNTHTVVIDLDEDTKVDVEEKADEDVIRFVANGTENMRVDDKKVEVSTALDVQGPLKVENSAVIIDNSSSGNAILDLQSTTKGILVPRLTDTQIAAISSPSNGLMVYNQTQTAFQFYNGTEWITMVGQDALNKSLDDLSRLKTLIHLETGL